MGLESRKIRLIMALRRSGISDRAVLSAMEKIPREEFAPALFHDQVYENRALPIGHGQTLSQPQVVALMTQSLAAEPRHKVLEIGTGSGYQTAILSRLARRVYSIERHKPLADEAAQRFQKLRLHNITSKLGDGWLGWPEQAPFDRIIVTAAAAQVPERLLEQLDIGGILVIPVGPERGDQELLRFVRTADGHNQESLGPVKFVPLLSGIPRDDLPNPSQMTAQEMV